jgi:hypothetical protein
VEVGVPVDLLQKTGKTGARDDDGRFVKGESGNPAGRRRGSKNRGTVAAQLLLEGQAEALTRKAIDLALGGDIAALRLCLSRIAAPRREPAVIVDLPPLDNAGDLVAAMTAISAAVADGAVTPGAAGELSHFVETFLKALAARNEEQRLVQYREEQARSRARAIAEGRMTEDGRLVRQERW